MAVTVAGAFGPIQVHAASSRAEGRIAFVRLHNGWLDIHTARADGTGKRRLTNNGKIDDIDPSWSPNGKRIAFARGKPGNHDIYLMGPRGGNVRRITSGKGDDTNVTWSPDGSRLAFDRRLPGTQEDEIFLVNVNGSGLTRFTSQPGFDGDPSWKPDGSAIAFTRHPEGLPEVWVKPVGVGEAAVLIDRYSYSPDWSPDGTKIAYVTSGEFQDDVAVANADGSGEIEIGSGTEYGGFGPDWAPGMDFVAFHYGCAHGECGGIAITRPDGTDHSYLGPGRAPSWRPV